jgi:4-hydroxy-2-oxoheptanedioate aldolase
MHASNCYKSRGKSRIEILSQRRVPGHDHSTIGFALDAGASIVVPQVETVEQARHIVSAMKYGMKVNGARSAPPSRFLPGLTDSKIDPSLTFQQNLNRQAALIIQIESLAGIQNLDAILEAVGSEIDSVWLGSLDCRVSMDMAAGGLFGSEPEWLEAVKLYEGTLRKYNKPASGLALGDPATVDAMARGRSFIVNSADMYALMGSGLQEQAYMRQRFPAKDHSKDYEAL